MSDLKSLGYITVSTNNMERWRHFAFDVLGFAKGSGPDPDALYLRMDERAARIIFVPGDSERVRTVGWEVRDRRALQRVKATLDSAGVAFKELSQQDADARRVEEVITFEDPAGTTLEVFHGAVLDHSPVITPFGARFVTGDQGLGHVVMPATDPGGLFDFYADVLGFRSRGAFRIPAPPEFGPIRCASSASTHAITAWRSARPCTSATRASCTSWWRSTPSTRSGRRWTGSMPRAFSCRPPWAGTPTTRWSRSTSARLGTGTSNSAPTVCASTKPITPQRKSPLTATGVTSG